MHFIRLLYFDVNAYANLNLLPATHNFSVIHPTPVTPPSVI